MSFLTRPIAWPSWKFGVLKFSMIAFGILMGSYFHEFWRQAACGISSAAVFVGPTGRAGCCAEFIPDCDRT